jgi:hypothetical protein
MAVGDAGWCTKGLLEQYEIKDTTTDSTSQVSIDDKVRTDVKQFADKKRGTVYAVKDSSAKEMLIRWLRKDVDQTRSSDVSVWILDASKGSLLRATIARADDSFWKTLLNRLVFAFVMAGAGAVACAFVSLIVGAPYTWFMFLAGASALVMGSGLQFARTRLL